MSDGFASLQTDFCARHCGAFDEAEENKHEYMSIFQDYAAQMAAHIERRLDEKIAGFSMAKLTATLLDRRADCDGDVLDLLLSLTDFNEFKEMILAFKRGRGSGIAIGDEGGASKWAHK